MVADAERFAGTLADGQSIDIHERMMQLTLVVVARTLFGAQIEGQVHQIGAAMTTSVRMFRRALMPWGMLLARLPLPSNIRFARGRRLLFDTIQRMIDQKRADGSDRDDFLSILLRARDVEGDGTGMSDQQLRDEAITIFTAGHETTANALTFTWWLLGKHPEVARRFHAELDQVLAGRTPTAADVPNLPYTRQVLSESMRLYPPVWTIGRRAIAPFRAGQYDLPAGTVVLMSQWVMHHDQRYWPEPMKFDPDRWRPDAKTDRPRYAYFPFSFGPRSCIGEAFAWMEATLLLATIGQKWRFEPAGAELELEPTITLRPKGALNMIARRRI
jgi:cytochrome P450